MSMAVSESSRKRSPPRITNDQQVFRLIDRALAIRYARHLLHKRMNVVPGQFPDTFKPRMDLWDNPDSPSITAMLELPGLKKDEISLRIVEGSLVIWGERHSRLAPDSTSLPVDTFPEQEIKYGKFRRVIPLPRGAQTNEVSASMTDGMLTISWPRIPAAVAAQPLAA